MLALNSIVHLLEQYKYLIVFPIAVFEGPIISVISGFLASKGLFNIYLLGTILIAGDIVGDTLYYCIGRFGGRPFITRWGRIFGLNETRVETVDKHFEKHLGKTMLFGKTQPYGSVLLTAAGISRVSYLKFIWYNFLGTVVKTTLLLIIGYYFGEAYNLIAKYLNYLGFILTILTIIIILIYMAKKWKKS